MKKKPPPKSTVYGGAWNHLRIECTKLHALAHLLEHEDTEGAEPLDIKDIKWGIGMLLDQSIRKICRISVQLEELEIEAQREGIEE